MRPNATGPNVQKRIQSREEIIKDAGKLLSLAVLCQNTDCDEADSGVFQSLGSRTDELTAKTPRRPLCLGAQFQGSRSEDFADGPRTTTEHGEENLDDIKLSIESRVAGAPLAQPESSRLTPVSSPSVESVCSSPLLEMEFLRSDSSCDEVDGFPSAVPLDKKPEEENDELMKTIGKQLATIGDSFEKERRRNEEGISQSSVSGSFVSDSVEKLVSDLTYDNFQRAVRTAIGEEPGLQQLAFVFRLASAVASKVGNASAAQDVNRFYLDYFTNNLADWVESIGGWRGVSQLM